MRYKILKEKNKLNGNSGCKLIIYKDAIYKVRKYSTNKTNSNRLFKQYQKLNNFKNSIKISTPKIYNTSKVDELFYFDMEYINGSTLSLFLMSQPISITKKIINEILNFIFECRKESSLKYKKKNFLEKIKKLKLKGKFKNKFFEKTFQLLNNHDWVNIKKSDSHGDLSLENIIINNRSIKFIDLSENFVNSYMLDISKILFDLISYWSFRNTNLKVDILKINSMKNYLIKTFEKKLSDKEFNDIKMLIILDFIRVLNYTKNKNEIEHLVKKLKIFYDNINNTMRW